MRRDHLQHVYWIGGGSGAELFFEEPHPATASATSAKPVILRGTARTVPEAR